MKPPTLEEVQAFCTLKGFTFKPLDFHTHYEVRGWRYGGKDGDEIPMKSWKKACYEWQRRESVGLIKSHARALVGSHEEVKALFARYHEHVPGSQPEDIFATRPDFRTVDASSPADIRNIQHRLDNRGEVSDEEMDRYFAWKRG